MGTEYRVLRKEGSASPGHVLAEASRAAGARDVRPDRRRGGVGELRVRLRAGGAKIGRGVQVPVQKSTQPRFGTNGGPCQPKPD